MGAAALALLVANSRLHDLYESVLRAPVGPALWPGHAGLTVHGWINDGLMAIFFLFVGLEIKREFLDGRLARWDRRRLPVIAAALGVLVPAAFYLTIVGGRPELRNGWAIPAATDIAFAIGVLALLGPRAPASLKLFLTTVAIVDDLGAVAIIALAYTAQLNSLALGAAAAILFVLYVLGKSGVTRLSVYVAGALFLWYAVLMSGVHATVAGVLAASTVPLVKTPGSPDLETSPLHRLEHKLSPWVAFLVVPLFGFANAGLSLEGLSLESLLAPLPLGIALGLFLGKQLGIFGSVWLTVRFGLAARPGGATWMQIYGVSILCGIGFTMSLFISTLAFPGAGGAAMVEDAKIGILLGSLLSAFAGFFVLRFARQSSAEPRRARSGKIGDGARAPPSV